MHKQGHFSSTGVHQHPRRFSTPCNLPTGRAPTKHPMQHTMEWERACKGEKGRAEMHATKTPMPKAVMRSFATYVHIRCSAQWPHAMDLTPCPLLSICRTTPHVHSLRRARASSLLARRSCRSELRPPLPSLSDCNSLAGRVSWGWAAWVRPETRPAGRMLAIII